MTLIKNDSVTTCGACNIYDFDLAYGKQFNNLGTPEF